MTAISTNGTGGGNSNSTSTYAGGVIPGDGDTLTVVAGDTLTGAADLTLGDNVSAVGNALTVNGTVDGFAGYTLTLMGTGTTANRAMYIAAGGLFAPADGATIEVDLASDGQTRINNQGDMILGACTVQAKAAYDVSSAGQTLSSASMATVYRAGGSGSMSVFPIGETTIRGAICVCVSPVSNAAGTGIGSFGDSSFSVVSVTTPSDALTTAVASLEACTSPGDYYVDHDNGLVWFYSNLDAGLLTCEYTANKARRRGFTIQSDRNGDSRFIAVGTTFNRLGSNFGKHNTEYIESGIYISNKVNGAVNSAREGKITGCTFNHCLVPLQVYGSTNTEANPLDLTGNTYNYGLRTRGNFSGTILLGYSHYIDISDSKFNQAESIQTCIRASGYVIADRLTGWCNVNSVLANVAGSYVRDCVLHGFGKLFDPGGFQTPGNDENPNTYTGNTIYHNSRAGRIGSNMVVTDNLFIQNTHHGFVAPSGDGYYHDIDIERNRIVDCFSTGDMGGGWTLGYNSKQWLHNISIINNTFDYGVRGIRFNDFEGTKVLGTKIRILNNIISNSEESIDRPSNDSNNITKMQVDWMDYNNLYNNTDAPDVAQATFMMSSTHYGSDEGNCTGIALFDPSSVPDASAKSLVMTIGSSSITLSWGGGSSVELVDDSGTVTTGGSASLTDSSKAWTADEHIAKYCRITSGTAVGQIYMIYDNTATSLSLISNLGSPVTIAVADTYEIVNSEVTLTDSGAETVQAGVHLPDVPTGAATYTDSGITVEVNSLTVDPQYADEGSTAYDYTPANSALADAGYDGSDIGAIAFSGSGGSESTIDVTLDVITLETVTLEPVILDGM